MLDVQIRPNQFQQNQFQQNQFQPNQLQQNQQAFEERQLNDEQRNRIRGIEASGTITDDDRGFLRGVGFPDNEIDQHVWRNYSWWNNGK